MISGYLKAAFPDGANMVGPVPLIHRPGCSFGTGDKERSQNNKKGARKGNHFQNSILGT